MQSLTDTALVVTGIVTNQLTENNNRHITVHGPAAAAGDYSAVATNTTNDNNHDGTGGACTDCAYHHH